MNSRHGWRWAAAVAAALGVGGLVALAARGPAGGGPADPAEPAVASTASGIASTASVVASAAAPAVAPAGPEPQRFARDGVDVRFSYGPVGGAAGGAILEGDRAEVRFRLADAATGEPLRGLAPAAWVDVEGALPGNASPTACGDKVPLYLKGHVGIRPLVDLNGYFVLVLNDDPSITVIDPVIGVAGKTSLYATILLRKPGADWVASRDGRRLFVSMPRAGKVAVIDTETFRVVRELDAGVEPTRLALQADGRYLWVGHGGPRRRGGVTVFDADSLATVGTVITGEGHHEVAFGPGDRLAFVTNRDAGTVTAIDVARLATTAELRTGPVPIAIAASPLSQAIYVADGATGEIAAIDPRTVTIVARIAAKPGLGPLRFTPDGRWGFAVNPAEQVVHVIDAASHRLVHDIALPGQPFQVAFTGRFAFVRLLDSERVQMIRLDSLGGAGEPAVQSFAAGARAPKVVPDLPLADSIVEQPKMPGVFVVSPGDGSTFGYMEGMNAPMGSLQNYGHPPRAVRVVDRSLRETEPGVYTGRLVVPASGSLEVALLLDAPRLVHCFRLEARENPRRAPDGPALAVDWTGVPARVAAGVPIPVRFRLADARTRGPREGLADVRAAVHAVAGTRTEVPAREVGGGVYEAEVRFPRAGAYYLHVASPAEAVAFGDLPFRAIRADPATPPARPASFPGGSR